MGRIVTVADAYYAYTNRPDGVDGNTRGYCRRFAYIVKRLPLNELTTAVVAETYATYAKRSSASIRRDMVAVKAMLNYALKEGAEFRMPSFNMPTAKSERVRALTREEEQRLLMTLAKPEFNWFSAQVLFMLNTGARPGEACQLRWMHVKKDQVILTTEKGGKLTNRAVPLNNIASLAIGASYSRGQRSEAYGSLLKDPYFVFLDDKYAPWKMAECDNSRSGYNMSAQWRALMEDAKIEDFHPNDCRHTFATRLRESGVALEVVSKLLGHTNITTTMRYAHINTESYLRDAVNKLTGDS